MSKKSSRNYSDRTLKRLWGRGAARCSMPSCRVDLLTDATDHDPMVVIGENAHVAASSDRGPRGDSTKEVSKRDEYENLILLCKNCHRIVDGQPKGYPLTRLLQIKHDHEEWVRHNLPERGKSKLGWRSILLYDHSPIDLELIEAALDPDFLEVDPLVLRTSVDNPDWQETLLAIRNGVSSVLPDPDQFSSRVAVFPLASVTSCITLGFCLSNRPRVRLFQYHRDLQSWSWPEQSNALVGIEEQEPTPDPEAKNVAFCFHLSGVIQDTQLEEIFESMPPKYEIRARRPSTSWLNQPEQLGSLAQTARKHFESAREYFPHAEKWHIFYFGPAPGAVIVGQNLNRTMSASIQLYEYQQSRTPSYSHSLCLR